jgi:hypothetical protein
VCLLTIQSPLTTSQGSIHDLTLTGKTRSGPDLLFHWPCQCRTMLIAGQFTIARLQKQPRYPPVEEWIMKMWYIHIRTYNGVLLNHKEEQNHIIGRKMVGTGLHVKQNEPDSESQISHIFSPVRGQSSVLWVFPRASSVSSDQLHPLTPCWQKAPEPFYKPKDSFSLPSNPQFELDTVAYTGRLIYSRSKDLGDGDLRPPDK